MSTSHWYMTKGEQKGKGKKCREQTEHPLFYTFANTIWHSIFIGIPFLDSGILQLGGILVYELKISTVFGHTVPHSPQLVL